MSGATFEVGGDRHHPTTGAENTCAVRGCARKLDVLRVTRSGWWVGYCEPHKTQAIALFDKASSNGSPTSTD